MWIKRLLPVMALIIGFVCITYAVQADDDHQQAYQLRSNDEILSLEEILKHLDFDPTVRILEIESEFEQGRSIYEIEFLTNEGSIHEVEVDAVTGEILEQERK